jgi:hypothetical protein
MWVYWEEVLIRRMRDMIMWGSVCGSFFLFERLGGLFRGDTVGSFAWTVAVMVEGLKRREDFWMVSEVVGFVRLRRMWERVIVLRR